MPHHDDPSGKYDCKPTSSGLQDLIAGIRTSSARLPMTTRVIAIDGPGGAGKSTLAERLSIELDNSPVVHTDDFASWETPLEWWPRLLTQILEPLSRNQPARYQQYDWETSSLAEWHDLLPTTYLILEGVSASREAFRPFLSYTVWVETPREERLRRGLTRDGIETYDLWIRWMAAEDAYIERELPHTRTDLIITGTDPY